MLSAVGCKNKNLDSESRQLQLAIGALDGNFNPFFYTSQNDGSMISMTQISMLTVNENGDIVCGDDQPTVVQSYTTTMKDSAGQVTTEGDEAATTEYEFVIKNGIKFSDGKDLTIKDVLFNFYVYLDPAYTGSATMYSTDIRGLKSYRSQVSIPEDSEDAGMEGTFSGKASVRINNLIDWSYYGTPSLTEQGQKDLQTVKTLFTEELESDWNNVSDSWEEGYKNSHRFTAAWQAYLYQEGIIEVQTKRNDNGAVVQIFEDKNGDGERQDGELYYTTLDPCQPGATQGEEGQVVAQHHIDEIAKATTDAEIDKYIQENSTSTGTVSREYAKEQLERKYSVDTAYRNYTGDRTIYKVLTSFASGSEALTEFTNDERTAYYDEIKKQNNGLAIKTISGITTYKNGAGNDVLKIVINGIDPKAIYNFSIPIAPLHYYSGTYNGHDYVAEANGLDKFGVEFSDSEFFKQVLQGQDGSGKNGLPMGAGAYMATNSKGGDASRRTFFENNICYFKRNEYFNTVAKNIDNAKIKYINYKVMSDDKILTALVTEEIDYGMPNANKSNKNQVVSHDGYLESKEYDTGGYGYVGINPKFVPEHQVREAIMKSFATKKIINYYGTELASIITRPMSKTSWAYPSPAPEEYPSIAFETDANKIAALVESAGYVKEGGIYTKRRMINGQGNARIGDKLKLTFTIAGESSDHPAYRMLMDAADVLNGIGFDVTVQTDLQALKKMTNGNLAVWAAAWSSATDPDMYQVYHKDSKASSVRNWNYPNILNNSSEWGYEYNIIQELSDYIDKGRETNDREGPDGRIATYAKCLDLVMDLAVEFPTYQRKDLCVYNKNVIDGGTLVKSPTHYVGLFDRIWEIDYVK